MASTNNVSDTNTRFAKEELEEVFEELGTTQGGLSDEEVAVRQKKYGLNLLSEVKQESIILLFLKNFTSLMAILLWVGGFVAIVSNSLELGLAIWMVNVINGIFSFIQEYRASQATQALKKMLPSYSRVLRKSSEEKILSEQLVPGDIVLIEEGDRISADGRLIKTTDLQVNQSALTGESNPIYKDSNVENDQSKTLIECDNMVFAGTTVSSGSATMVVTAIGMQTQFGQIADLTQGMKSEKSPLQRELDRLTKQISIISITVGIIFFLAATFFVKEPVSKSFIFALGMIVAFIPEGLLPTVTLSLAMAVQRMAKEHALVKKLSSVETLGATSVICSDKTGTLTQNGKSYQVTGLGYAPEGQILFEGDNICFGNSDRGDLEKLIRFAHLCSNAQVLPPNDDRSTYTVLGDPTEACLNVLLEKSGINRQENRKFAPRLKELPFDSVRKRMTTIHSLGGDEKDKKISITKGAPKEILNLSDYVLSDDKVIPLNKEERNKIQLANDTFAKDGLRVLAVSYCDIEGFSKEQWTQENLEQHMVFIGLIAMSDPPREGVREAIDKCHAASIRIIMVTGDYGLTALSIAKNIGIIRNDNAKVISGLELSEMTDSQLKKELSGEVVFARVAPEQKYRVVTILQEMGEVVAVTGDGVNDAPALKKSDIGVAMGVTGTDVAKESADMILTDDHFASIVHAVEEGRAVYQNIKKFLTYIFNSNTPAVDLGTDMLPALGLGVEPPETDVMNRPPRRLTDRLLDKGLLIKSFLWYGTIESVLAMGGFFWAHYLRYGNFTFFVANGIPYREATTMTLGAIIFSQIGMVMNSRTSYQSIRALSIFGNKLINFGIIMEILAFLVLVYVPPFHNLFNTASLGLSHWLYLISCPFIMIGLDEVRKLFSSRKNKR
ncbi:TPA: cation-transporting P-type ATPase [Streptococcus agalactiae]|nr:cation-transporting P-type ATPase [Streptococcus agalactiae]HEO4532136.1 cation-transporting P-type ATPase [Streptococcus agalactiae]